MFYTIATIATIFLVLLYWFYKLLNITFLRIFRRLNQHKRQQYSGRMVEGRVVSAENIGERRDAGQMMKMEVEYPNFSGTLLRKSFTFTDSKPYSRRYEVGNKINLRLDPDGPVNNWVSMVGSQMKANALGLAIQGILVLGYLGFVLWFALKTYGSYQADADALGESLSAQGVLQMVGLYLLIGGFHWLLFRGLGLFSSGAAKNTKMELLQYGITATARIGSYEKTGTRINDNPMVRFHYQFEDGDGISRRGKDEIIINELDIGRLPDMREREILYLPQNPDTSHFKENVTAGGGMGGFVGGVLMFVFFVFSAVVVGMFWASL